MPWKGELQRDVPFTIDIANDILDKAAITIVKVNQRGGTHLKTATIPVGASVTLNELLGPRIVRMILRAHLPPAGRMNLVVMQGTSQWSDQLEADSDLVWNVVA